MQTGCGSAFDQGKGQGKNMRDYQTYIGEICDTLLFPAEAKETMEQAWEKICANAAAKETFLKWLLVYEADGKLDYKEVLKAADTAAKEAEIASADDGALKGAVSGKRNFRADLAGFLYGFKLEAV